MGVSEEAVRRVWRGKERKSREMKREMWPFCVTQTWLYF